MKLIHNTVWTNLEYVLNDSSHTVKDKHCVFPFVWKSALCFKAGGKGMRKCLLYGCSGFVWKDESVPGKVKSNSCTLLRS